MKNSKKQKANLLESAYNTILSNYYVTSSLALSESAKTKLIINIINH